MPVAYENFTPTSGSSEAHYSDAQENARWEEAVHALPDEARTEQAATHPLEQDLSPNVQTIAPTGAPPLTNMRTLESSSSMVTKPEPAAQKNNMDQVPIVSSTMNMPQAETAHGSVKLVEPVVPPTAARKPHNMWPTFPNFGHHDNPPRGSHSNLRVSKHDIEEGPWGYETRRGSISYPALSGISIVDDEDEASVHTVVDGSKLEEAKNEEDSEHIIVKWDGKDDREHVLQFPFWYRVYLMALAGTLTLCTAFCSSVPSSVLFDVVKDLHTTSNVVKASVFLFVASFCVGPLVWAPLSEMFGRRIVFIVSFVGFVCFNVGCMLSPNIASLIVCRIFAGAFGSSSMSNSPSMIASLFHMKYLMVTVTIFALMPIAGPCLGPIVGGYITQAGASWRWVYRVCTIFSFTLLVLIVFTMPETMDAQRLQKKAKRLRKETGDDRYVAPVELRDIEWLKLPGQVVGKPIKMIIVEPMLLATTVYISFVYGTLYLLFVAYPYVFEFEHHLKPGSTGLTFLGFFVGCLLAGLYCITVDQQMYVKGMERNGGKPLAPEVRLRPCMLGSVLLTVSLFWFAWTSFDFISFWSPLVAGGMFGSGLFFIFMSLFTYVVEVYIYSSASAIAINTVFRSAFGAGFPMFGEQMYERLNSRWATTVLAFIALAMKLNYVFILLLALRIHPRPNTVPASDKMHASVSGETTFVDAQEYGQGVPVPPSHKVVKLYDPVNVAPVAQPASNASVPLTAALAGKTIAVPASEGDAPVMSAPVVIKTTRNVPVTERCLEEGPWSHEGSRGSLMIPQAHGLDVKSPGEHPSERNDTDHEKGAVHEEDEFIVKWDGVDDRENVMNLNIYYRLYLVALNGVLTLCTAFCSAAPTAILPQMVMEFRTTPEVAKASVFLFVGAFSFAPLVWAPMSEMFGRRIVFIISYAGFVCFNVGCMLAPNIASMIVFRILAGACGSSSFSNSPAVIASLFSLKYLVIGIVVFAFAPTGGPCLGPIVGGYVSNAGANWRWVFRACTIFSFVMLLLVVFTMPETLDALRLKKKAQRLRKETGKPYVAPIERRHLEFSKLPAQVIGKPIKMLFTEPMLFFITLYLSFLYGTVYLLFIAYPAVFGVIHGFRQGGVGLTFLGFFTGCILGGVYCLLVDQRRYLKAFEKNNGQLLPPERRIESAMGASIIITAALFWFAWTSLPSVSFWSPLIAGGLFGTGVFMVFMGFLVYITEVYIANAASAMAANTIVRSAFGAGFPMFGEQMYRNLEPKWASTVLAFIALAMVPIPFALYKFGPQLRRMSRSARAK
ncbi:hypothetical protein MCAP1_003056 [Malassezia caprae]|uniref:Major facilitator superfamily (MFS) profile domain-containing protein n=1 Tax=Malassezia caprae TaxID=1381934 RepID=A0AAF0E6V9_9BASI|nr:hypothetical protein MCAP1_003056 [Malassezia caprae]